MTRDPGRRNSKRQDESKRAAETVRRAASKTLDTFEIMLVLVQISHRDLCASRTWDFIKSEKLVSPLGNFPIEVWTHPTWFNPTGQILTPGYGKPKGPKPLDWRAVTLDCKPTQDPSSKPLKAARLRVQQHCAGVAHFVLCFHPDHHALPLWLTRFIQQLVCQIPAPRGLKATSKWRVQQISKHSATGPLARREACPGPAEQRWVTSQMLQKMSTQDRFSSRQSMLPASFCISGVCWTATS